MTDPTSVPRRRRKPRFVHALTIIIALAIVVFAAGDIYHYATKTNASEAKAVVATWTPNHKDFCGGLKSLVPLVGSSLQTSTSQTTFLNAFETLSVYAPTKLFHNQLAAIATAFAGLEGDQTGLKAVNANPTPTYSKDPLVEAYLTAAIPFNSSSSLGAAMATCDVSNPAANSSTAIAMVDAASLSAFATGATGPITLAEIKASASTSSGSYSSITLDRSGVVKIAFASGPAVCLPLPAAGNVPKVTTC